jgi:valyl-tRNA synthetase
VFRARAETFVLAGVLALAGLVCALPALAQSGGGKSYCCTDQTGRHFCGDILPAQCYGHAYREIGANGRTIREIPAPMTAEQRAQRAAEEEQRQKDAVLKKEQNLKDLALLETYADLKDIESMRQRALDDVRKLIVNAETRIAEIIVLHKKFENEAEFYKKKTLPPEIEKGLANTEFESKAQKLIIEAKKKEMAVIQEKYDEDRKRFLDLQHNRGVKSPP